MREPEPAVILGTSTFAVEVLDVVEATGGLEVTAFVENADHARSGTAIEGRPVLWVDELEGLAATHRAVSAEGLTPLRRRFVLQAERLGMAIAGVRHPAAVVSPTASIGVGGVIGPGVVVAARARVGAHALLNRGALIGHHAHLDDYVTVSPGANLAGGVTVGQGAYVGMGAIVLDGLSVGAHSVIAAGAVVTRDVPERVRVMGVPARVVKRA